MISSIVSRLVILVFGTLYPAYASYKAVRTKNVKEYVKWMMYWIVFALFTCAETFTDVFLSFWFPFYYEIKIILVLWLLSPATKGSSILYRKFVHPMLSRREQEIDEYIAKAKEQGYHTVLHLGTKGVNYATTVLMQTAIKGGGGLVNQLRRSYSLSDLSSDKESDMNRNSKALKNVPDEDDMEEETDGLDPRMLRPRGYSPRRSASGSGRVEMYFPEVDVDVRQHGSSRPREPSIPLSHIRSSEDVSSGYSSAEPLYAGHHVTKSEGLATSREPLVRTASVGSTRSMRTKSSRGGVVAKRGPAAEGSELLDPQGDDADYHYQEEYFYDVSSSLSSYVSTSIPFPVTVTENRSAAPLSALPEISYPSAQNEVNIIPSDISDMTSVQEQYIDASDVKQDSPDDEDVPLYDAESDESKISNNELLLPETSISSVKEDIVSTSSHETSLSKDVTVPNLDMAADGIIQHTVVSSKELVLSKEPLTSHLNTFNKNLASVKEDIVSTSSHETSSSKDVTMPNLDMAADGMIQHTVVSSTELVLSNEPLTSHLNTFNKNLVSDTFIVHTENNNIVETFTENKNRISVQEKCSVINVKDLHSEQKVTQHIGAEPKILIHDKTDIISDYLEVKTQKLDNIVSDSLKYVEPSSLAQPTHTTPEVMEALDTTTISSDVISEPLEKDEHSASDEREVNSVADDTVSETLAAMATYPLTPTSAESLSPDNTMDLSSESQDSKYDAGVDQSNNYAGITSDLNSRHVLIDKPITDTLQSLEDERRTPKLDESFETSAGGEGLGQTEGSDVQPLQVNSSCAYESLESLSPLEPPIRSSSQSSLRKEGRAGRYHKGPAPTPPTKSSEPENENWTDVQEPKILSDIIKAPASPKELGEFEHSPQAIESEDSEAAVTARLVLKPGVVRSLGPDFGTKAEVFVSRTPQAKSKRSKSKKKQGDSALSRLFVLPKNQFGGLSSFFPFWPGKQEASTSASTENGTPESSNPYGLSALESSSSSAFVPVHEKTSSASLKHSDSRNDVNVKEMSHSPVQRHRAPLAGWE